MSAKTEVAAASVPGYPGAPEKSLMVAAETKVQSPPSSSCNSSSSSSGGSATSGSSISGTNFIRQIIQQDLRGGKHSAIVTRFPPEPNGFLHIGHAKSICLNFGLAKEFGGKCHLRFDDTNPCKEEHRYIQSIQEDLKWLGFCWGDGNLFFASDYFDQFYEWAESLVLKNLAYVDTQTPEELKRTRGSITEPGVPSPFRDRSVEDNLRMLRAMRAGEYEEGAAVLRAKIDMAASNMNMRDPILYRILKAEHPRTGRQWVVYPTYDFAHGQSDSIERITHSICTLEFELHRPLYEWLQRSLGIFPTRQIEFARLNCSYTVVSKRKLLALVTEGWVNGWDDPRMSTLSGLRRRGYPPEAIRDFCDRVGVAKRENVIQIELLESCVRERLNQVAQRRLGVLRPVRVVITNFDAQKTRCDLTVANHPLQPELGMRPYCFGPEIYIDREDITTEEPPPPGYKRLALNREVRLRYGYWIICRRIVMKTKEGGGEDIDYLECTYDPDTYGGASPSDGRTVKGAIHWIPAELARPAEYRLYNRLFTSSSPERPCGSTKSTPEADDDEQEVAGRQEDRSSDTATAPATKLDWRSSINKDSLKVVHGFIEKTVYDEAVQSSAVVPYQLERVGYFVRDPDTTQCIEAAGTENGHYSLEALQHEQGYAKARVVFNLVVELTEPTEPSSRDARQRAIEEKKKKKAEQGKKKLKDKKLDSTE